MEEILGRPATSEERRDSRWSSLLWDAGDCKIRMPYDRDADRIGKQVACLEEMAGGSYVRLLKTDERFVTRLRRRLGL